MDVSITSGTPERVQSGIVAVGVFADGTLTAAAQAIDTASHGTIAAMLKRGDLEDNAGATLMLHDVAGVAAERVLVVSLGKKEDFGDRSARDALGSIAKVLAGSNASDAKGATGRPLPLLAQFLLERAQAA